MKRKIRITQQGNEQCPNCKGFDTDYYDGYYCKSCNCKWTQVNNVSSEETEQ